MLLSMTFDSSPIRFYAVYDYWHSGPNFFLMRCGILLVIYFSFTRGAVGVLAEGIQSDHPAGKDFAAGLLGAHRICLREIFDPAKGQCSQLKATGGLIVIFLAMLALSLLRTSWKKRTVSVSR